MPVIMAMGMPMAMTMAMTKDYADGDNDSYYDGEYDRDAGGNDDCGVGSYICSAHGCKRYNRLYCKSLMPRELAADLTHIERVDDDEYVDDGADDDGVYR